jgi:hypothetical protein
MLTMFMKYILLLIVLWMAVRLLRRIVRFSFVFRRDHSETRHSTIPSSGTREQVQEAEYEVIESHIKKDE